MPTMNKQEMIEPSNLTCNSDRDIIASDTRPALADTAAGYARAQRRKCEVSERIAALEEALEAEKAKTVRSLLYARCHIFMTLRKRSLQDWRTKRYDVSVYIEYRDAENVL